MEFDKNICPVVDIQGAVAGGKQFDLEIIVPEDGRDVIYGVVKDCHREPIKDAVVKLIEVDNHCDERKPISHTFTDEYGQFVFGPLCGNKEYEVQIWVNNVKHVKVCAKCDVDEKCLKGVKMDKCDKHCEKKCEKKYEENDDKYNNEKDKEDKKESECKDEKQCDKAKKSDYPCVQYSKNNYYR